MIYWDNQLSFGSMNRINSEFLSGEGSVVQQCADYCLSFDGCLGMAVTKVDPSAANSAGPISEVCYINSDAYTRGPQCWGTPCQIPDNFFQTVTFGVFRDYYEENPQNLPADEPAGVIATSYDEVEDLCGEINTGSNPGFGNVNYRITDGIAFTTDDNKNVVRESGSNCAAECFQKAGCSAFYRAGSDCYFIIGSTNGGQETNGVSESGMLHNLCPDSAFSNSFTRRSQFYCLVFSPSQLGSISAGIIRQNTGSSNTPLRQWTFERRQAGVNVPMVASSRYVALEDEGYSGRYRGLRFSIETHVRTGTNQSRRRRRADQSELVPVGELSMKDDLKIHKQAAKEEKQAAKLRSMMPRTDDILAEIQAIEEEATNFILNDLQMPDDIEVAATSPIEVVEFVQTAADGSVAADCSSGSCECSPGFVDNGNGCEEMTEEQAATTSAPTTLASTTTGATPTGEAREFLLSLETKMAAVLADNGSGKPRSELIRKWGIHTRKFLRRYEQMVEAGCDFTDTYEDNSVDFDSTNTCWVTQQVGAAFSAWGRQFTPDCNKENRDRHLKWFERSNAKFQRFVTKTQSRVNCN